MSRVPGTFKQGGLTPQRVENKFAQAVTARLQEAGALHAETWIVGECSVIVSREAYKGEWLWHLSIAHPSRYPSWDEVKTAAYGIPTVKLPRGRTFAQLLGPVAEGEWVDVHENTFHLWEIVDPTFEFEKQT